MENDYYKLVTSYKSAMMQARVMLSKGLITADEYIIIETKMCKKYGINFCSLFRENEWINTDFRGNMSTEKEAKQWQKQ